MSRLPTARAGARRRALIDSLVAGAADTTAAAQLTAHQLGAVLNAVQQAVFDAGAGVGPTAERERERECRRGPGHAMRQA